MYAVPKGFVETEYEVKKSRFITRVVPVENRQQAMQVLDKARQDYPDARHHCWAYLLGDSEANSQAAMSDDGEPSGTAGKPILNVIQHKQIGNIIIIVIRYFGGIKLGAGGLVRAYSSAAQQGIENTELIQPVPMKAFLVVMPFAQEQAFRHFASQYEAVISTVNYAEKVEIEAQLPEQFCVELERKAAIQGWQIKINIS